MATILSFLLFVRHKANLLVCHQCCDRTLKACRSWFECSNSPDYFVKSGRCDLGVAWNDVTEPQDDAEPLEYISVKLDGPEMAKPINAALFHRDDGADLVWSRPKTQ